ncbi:MAG: carbohydrate ABC transporter permease [Anaerolineae bacterium]
MASISGIVGAGRFADVRNRADAAVARGHARGHRWAGYLAMAVAVLAAGLPVYWMLVGAFKPNDEVYRLPPTWLPLQPTLANFAEAWQAAPFGRYYVNTFVTTLLGSGFEVFFAVTSAYAFAFLPFPRKDWLFVLLLAALMVPAQVTVLPNFLTVSRLGWVNTYQGIVVPGASVAYGTFLLRQYYLTLPPEIFEAARADGAGRGRVLAEIVLPLGEPSIITFALISIVAKWNDFLWPLIVTNTREMRVLSTGIYWLMAEEGSIQWSMVMAATLFVVLPVLLVYLFAQRFIIEGLAAGAVKG